MIRAIFAALILLTLGFAASAQRIDMDTKCGAPATGMKAGSREPLTLDAAGAQYMRVGPDGVWMFCRPEDVPRQPVGCRVPADAGTWAVGAHQCSAGTQMAQGLEHGGQWSVQARQGSMRGLLVLSCNDGTLSRPVMTCAPATECDTAIRMMRTTYEGGKQVTRTYTYDARPSDKRVPLGGYVMAAAEDGATKRVQCVAGVLVEAPKPPPAVASAPPVTRAVQCKPQTVTAWVEYRYMPLQYAGHALPVGASTTVSGVKLTCGADGKLKPPAAPDIPWQGPR